MGTPIVLRFTCATLVALALPACSNEKQSGSASQQGSASNVASAPSATAPTDAVRAVDAPPPIDATATLAEEVFYMFEEVKIAMCVCADEACIARAEKTMTEWVAMNAGRMKALSPTPEEDERADRFVEEIKTCKQQAVSRSLPADMPWLVEPVKVRLDGDWGVVSNAKLAKVGIKATKRVDGASEASPCVRLLDRDGVELESGTGDDPNPSLAKGTSEVLTISFLVKRPLWEETAKIEAYLASSGCSSPRHEASSNVLSLDRDQGSN